MPKPMKSKIKNKSSNKKSKGEQKVTAATIKKNTKAGGPGGKKKKNITKTPIAKDFDSFRHEIYKFGLTGLDKKDQLSARVELAIKLGAKPKRWIKPNYNLSSEQQEKRVKRQEETNKQLFNTNLKIDKKY